VPTAANPSTEPLALATMNMGEAAIKNLNNKTGKFIAVLASLKMTE